MRPGEVRGNVAVIKTTGLPDDFVPPDMSVTAHDEDLPCSEEDCRPGRGGKHDVLRQGSER